MMLIWSFVLRQLLTAVIEILLHVENIGSKR